MMVRRFFQMITCSMLLAACSGSAPPIAESATGANPESPAESFNRLNYRIGPGDALQIFVWRNPEISTNVPVRPDGKISMPLVEDMVAVGKTPSELARDIEEVLATFIKSPSVNVIVSNFQGTFSGQIRVVGQAANPQSVPYRDGMTILDVLIEVGGLGEFAAGNRAKLVRNENGSVVEYRVRLHDLVNKGDIKQNAEVQPGDVLIIPETFF
jgi:polysaccharide export outer membrane protein